MRNFKELDVWKEGRLLAKETYLLTRSLPEEEKFGLTSQIRRCVVSIPSNIAEGAAKESQKDFARFLQISLGSCFELESHFILCSDLEFVPNKEIIPYLNKTTQLQKRIYSFIKYLNNQA